MDFRSVRDRYMSEIKFSNRYHLYQGLRKKHLNHDTTSLPFDCVVFMDKIHNLANAHNSIEDKIKIIDDLRDMSCDDKFYIPDSLLGSDDFIFLLIEIVSKYPKNVDMMRTLSWFLINCFDDERFRGKFTNRIKGIIEFFSESDDEEIFSNYLCICYNISIDACLSNLLFETKDFMNIKYYSKIQSSNQNLETAFKMFNCIAQHVNNSSVWNLENLMLFSVDVLERCTKERNDDIMRSVLNFFSNYFIRISEADEVRTFLRDLEDASFFEHLAKIVQLSLKTNHIYMIDILLVLNNIFYIEQDSFLPNFYHYLFEIITTLCFELDNIQDESQFCCLIVIFYNSCERINNECFKYWVEKRLFHKVFGLINSDNKWISRDIFETIFVIISSLVKRMANAELIYLLNDFSVFFERFYYFLTDEDKDDYFKANVIEVMLFMYKNCENCRQYEDFVNNSVEFNEVYKRICGHN